MRLSLPRRRTAQASDLQAFGGLLPATLLAVAAATSIGVGISALSPGQLQATAAAVSVWLLLAFGVDVLTATVLPGLGLGPPGLLVTVLANSLESARILALLAAGPDGAGLGVFSGWSVGRFGADGSLMLLVALLLAWTVLPLAVATRALQRRDL
jgi:Cu-processing system permease protein